MDTNLTIQYTVVAVLILLALGYLIHNIRRKNKTKGSAGGACCGCSLADTCTKRRKTPSPLDKPKDSR